MGLIIFDLSGIKLCDLFPLITAINSYFVQQGWVIHSSNEIQHYKSRGQVIDLGAHRCRGAETWVRFKSVYVHCRDPEVSFEGRVRTQKRRIRQPRHIFQDHVR